MSYFGRAAGISKQKKSISTLPPTEVFILQFINPFHEKYSHLKHEYKLKYFARNKILRLFKCEPMRKKQIIETSVTINHDEVSKGSAFSFPSDKVNHRLLYPNISSVVKENITWLTDCLSKKNKTDRITKYEFNVTMISIVLFTIQELGYNYKLSKSMSEEEIFVKVTATEDILREHASNMDYRLKFKAKSYWKQDFQQVPPFGPIWLSFNEGDKQKDDLFVKYDETGKETSANGSYFMFTDKYRIVYNEITKKMDLHVLKDFDLLITSFVPHEPAALLELKDEWASLRKIKESQPIDKIKTYFCDQVAFYFCWLENYKNFMIVAAIFGVVVFCSDVFSYFSGHHSIALFFEILFCLFLAVWAVAFEQSWIRKEKELAWKWGTLNFGEQQIQREDFKGNYEKDEVTGRMRTVKVHKIKDKSIKIFSFSTIFMFVTLVITVIILVFSLRVYLLTLDYWKDKAPLITAIIYAIQINIFDVIYTLVAKYLTIWENHETMNEYNNSFALKLFMFRFVNNYSALFYTAFFKEEFEGKCGFEGCLSELGFQLSIIFIVNIVLNIIELGLPWFLYKFREKKVQYTINKKNSSFTYPGSSSSEIEKESKFEPYDYVIEDYMEMCIQYGFIAMFGASFPLVASFALLEIVIEIRIDAIKLCKYVRRPEPVKTEDIGIWKKIILFITLMGVFSNSGIIIITSDLLDDFMWQDKFTIFIIFEHILIIVIVILRYMIPDTPELVSLGSSWAKRIIKDKMAGKIDGSRLNQLVSENSKLNNFFLKQKKIKKIS